MGAGENPLERHPDARLESALGRAGLVQGHQGAPVVGGQRPAVGGGAEPVDDLAGARERVVRSRRPAAEDAPPARRVGDADRIERPPDGEVPEVRQAREAVGVGHARARQRPLVGRDEILGGALQVTDEHGRDPVRPRRHPDRIGAEIDAVRVRDVHPPVDVEEGDALAVDGDLDLLRMVDRVQRPAAAAEQLSGRLVVERDAEPVVGVGGERVHYGDAAPRAVGGALDLLALRDPPRDLVGRLAGAGRRVAHGEPADLRRGLEIAVHQGGGEQLRVGDVVEPRALGVERQVVARLDVESEQVADGPLVLGAVEALEAAARRERLSGRGVVDQGLQGAGERLELGLAGAGGPRGGHQARPDLADDLLGQRTVGGGVRDLEAVQRQVAVARPVVVAAAAGQVDDGLGRVDLGRPGLGGRVCDRPEREADGDSVKAGRLGVHHRRITLSPLAR